MDLAWLRPYRVRALARLELYSTTSLDALVRTTGAAWENEGGKVEVGARFVGSSPRGGQQWEREGGRPGDREKEGKKEKTTEREGGLPVNVGSPIDSPRAILVHRV